MAAITLIAAFQSAKYARDKRRPGANRARSSMWWTRSRYFSLTPKERAEVWRKAARNFYHLGITALLAGLAFTLALQHVTDFYCFSLDHQRGYRWLVRCAGGVFKTLWEDHVAYEVGRAYDLVVAAVGPHTGTAVRYGRSFAWRCPSCDRAISDRGLIAGPADDEPGHAGDCPRLAAAIAEWDAGWEAEP